MASSSAKTGTKKQEVGKKRKLPQKFDDDDMDLFSYGNKMELTFSYSTKNTKTMVTIDSSDEEDDDLAVEENEFTRISDNEEENEGCEDDSEDILNITDSEDSLVECKSNNDKSHTRSPSPPPPPSQADLLRVQRQLRAKNKKTGKINAKFDTAFSMLKQTVNDTISPITNHTRQTADVINLDDSVSPAILRNHNRKMKVKVRTRSQIKRFDMKAGDKFATIMEDLADSLKVTPENILLSLNNSNILPEDTPLSKGVTVADIIECIVMESAPIVDEENLIEIKIQGNDTASRKTFNVTKTKPLETMFAEYATFRNVKRSNLKFSFDGDPLQGTETPEDLDMEDENVIDVRVL